MFRCSKRITKRSGSNRLRSSNDGVNAFHNRSCAMDYEQGQSDQANMEEADYVGNMIRSTAERRISGEGDWNE